MPPATRSRTASPVKPSATTRATGALAPPSAREPLKHFILPTSTTDRARCLLLRHPRDAMVQRFLFCPEAGLFHFSQVAASPDEPRSLLFTKPRAAESPSAPAPVPTSVPEVKSCPTDHTEEPPEVRGESKETRDEQETAFSDGYISQNADLYVATPFDLAFLLLPLALTQKAASGKMLFQPLDDIFDPHTRDDQHLRFIFDQAPDLVRQAMARICDTIDAGDEDMYRPNEEKILRMLVHKVETAVQRGLPPSLEEHFVTRPLETPMLSVKREDTAGSTAAPSVLVEDTDSVADSLESQAAAPSTAVSFAFSEVSATSSVSTVTPDPAPPAAPAVSAMHGLQQRRTGLDFLLASCVPLWIAERLQAKLDTGEGPIDFRPLQRHLVSLAALKADAMASRSIGDYGRKRGLEDDEAAEVRAEKKRKQEEDEKRKKLGESRGVRDLKKVNVAGMKKMSDFFAKKPVVAKATG